MTDGNKDDGTDKNTKYTRRKAIIILGSFFLILGFIWLLYYIFIAQFEEYTDDAYVNGNVVELMPQVSGTITEISADDTQFVSQGETIIRLDPADTLTALQGREAELAETVRKVRQYYENAERVDAELTRSRADLVKAELDLKRRVGLVGDRAISREEMQHFQAALQTAEANYQATLRNLRVARALVENSHLYTHPEVERAKANLKVAYLNYHRINILAPVSGYVAKRGAQVGQHVNTNTPMLAIVPLDQVWIDANYKESQLNHLRVGQPVTISADAYSDISYHGKVVGLNAGTGAAFALLPPQNATGNWIKIVQRLPVRIIIDPDELKKNPLEIGLSMRVTTNTHHRNGNRLAVASPAKPLYFTDVYAKQLANVDTLIMKILQDNSSDLFLPKLEKRTNG